MARLDELKPEFVELIPEYLELGTLYVSRKYQTATHLCACGCGEKVVTPIGKPYGWQFTESDGVVSLHPSIGNFQIPCKTHYWIKENQVHWL